jgi:hypothetical protein
VDGKAHFLAVHLVGGEVDQVTQQVGTCLFLKFATGEFVQRFTGLSGPARQESPALNTAADYDLRFIRHGNQMEPRDKMLGWHCPGSRPLIVRSPGSSRHQRASASVACTPGGSARVEVDPSFD